MTRLLMDLNVLLDVLLDRAPHAAAAAALWAEVELGRAEGLIPAHGVTTIFYLAQRSHDRAFARQAVADLLSVYRVAPVDEPVLRRALALEWPDFEDAVCAVAAHSAGCNALVTRDPHDFLGSPLPVLSPVAALAMIRAVGG